MFHRRRRASRARSASRVSGTAEDWRSFDAVAGIYERVRAPLHEPPARDLVSLVDPGPGARILDVGTGTGVAASMATERVGPEGLVVGIDVSLEMVRLAGRKGLRVAAAEAIDLPFRDATFDAVVANFVIFFFRRFDTALYDIVRVLRPGGRLGVTTWGPEEDEFGRTWRQIAESFVGREVLRDADARAAPWQEHFSDRDRLEAALRGAGLRPVRVERRQYRGTSSLEDHLAGRETGVRGRFLRQMLGPQLWERFRLRVRDEFQARFRDPIGDTSDVLLAVGTKPPT